MKTLTLPEAQKPRRVHLSRVSSKERALFTHQLGAMLDAGVSLTRALEVLIKQQKNKLFRETIMRVLVDVRAGMPFSGSLKNFPNVFDDFYTNMVSAGEASAQLPKILKRLSLYLDKSMKARQKILSAMLYPAVVMSVSFLVVALLLFFVVPRFESIFQSTLQGQSLPFVTEALMHISSSVQSHPSFILCFCVMVMAFGFAVRYLKSVRSLLGRLLLQLPYIGTFIRKLEAARFTYTLSVLLKSGVPMLTALRMAQNVCSLDPLKDSLDLVYTEVQAGQTLASSMQRRGWFPEMLICMVEVGEEGGLLHEMLLTSAESYQDEVDRSLGTLVTLVEPAMIITLAVIVGTIVLALFLPIMSLVGNLAI